jgi:stage V sporulation protein AC
MTNKEYKKYAERSVKKSPCIKNCICAFFIGGSISLIGQIIVNIYFYFGFSLEDSFTLCCITLIFLSAFFTALGLYDKIAKYGGAGTLVPITGFANAVVSPAIEFKNEGFIMGVGANMFKIAGPVIVFGVTASVIGGLIFYLF